MLILQPQGHVTTPIMPARPLCMLEDTTMCPVVRELRAWVDALEWLREVEQARGAWLVKRYRKIGRKRYDSLVSQHVATHFHARKEAGV